MTRPTLTTRLRDLERRLARLEAERAAPPPPPPPPLPPGRQDPADLGGPVEYARELASRRGRRFRRGTVAGAAGYAGSVRVGDRRYLWAREVGVGDWLEADPGQLARWLTAIASPVRLRLLLDLLGRDRSSAELASVLGDPSPGQVYHHLKELQAAGILVQPQRGVYRVAPAVLIPLLVVVSAAIDALGGTNVEAGEPFPTMARSS